MSLIFFSVNLNQLSVDTCEDICKKMLMNVCGSIWVCFTFRSIMDQQGIYILYECL